MANIEGSTEEKTIVNVSEIKDEKKIKKQDKNVNFDFFQVWKISDSDTKIFDLDDWAQRLPSVLDERNIRYNGDTIRCDGYRIHSPENNPMSILHFARLRDHNVPAVATLNTPELNDVKLEANEYIAEDVSALFDSTNGVLMLQKNIFSLSVYSLATYVNYFWNLNKDEEDMEQIEIRPILRKDAFKLGLNAKKINKLKVKTGNIVRGKNDNAKFKSGLGKVFEVLTKYSGVSIEVTISTTRSKDSVLDKEAVYDSLKEIQAAQGDFKKATIVSGDTGVSVPIDLIKSRITTSKIFSIPVKAFLNPDKVQEYMLQEYSPSYKNFKKQVEGNLEKIPK